MGEDSARLGAGQHAGLRILLIAGDPGGPFEVVPRELRETGVVLMNFGSSSVSVRAAYPTSS
jgi:hypothetical protein